MRCSECAEETVMMCPFCRLPVCATSYGLYKTCGLRHEAHCAPAKESRDRTAMEKSAPKNPRSLVREEAERLARILIRKLEPVCHRVETVGALWCGAPRVDTIELLAVSRYGDVSLACLLWEKLDFFVASDYATYVDITNTWRKLKTPLPEGYGIPEIEVDIYRCDEEDWRWEFQMRTMIRR